MRLGIVGHGAEKFTTLTQVLARTEINAAIDYYGATRVISGRSPMGGIDIWAVEIARERGLAVREFPPRKHCWSGPGGFKERNLAIAADSDLVLCVVVANLPEGFEGMQFKGCYHCYGRNPEHVKSGGCWTTWRAKEREWRIV